MYLDLGGFPANYSDTNNEIFNWNELIPTLVVYSFTFVLGLVGNCLIIFTTFQYRRMKSVTNVFLSSLASADLLLIIVCIPVKLAEKFSYTWEMGAFACKFVHYLQNVSAICSVMNLTGISIERYYAIVHPMRAKYICTIKQAKRIILILWILSFLFGIPTLFAQGHLPVKDNGKEFFHCRKDWHASLLWRFHEVYMFVVILIIPFTIMTYSYSRICWEVWNVMKRRVVMTSKHALTRARSKNENTPETSALPEDKPAKSDPLQDDTHMVKQVVYMLVAVVVLFAICWAPILIDNILTAYEYLPQYRAENLEYMNLAFVLMAYFNSCINPIIYGFMSKSFRESFKLVLCCNFAEARPSSLSSYSLKYVSHTKNTTT